jgi:hypothetical protein
MRSLVFKSCRHTLETWTAVVRFADGTGIMATFMSEAGANDWCLRQHQRAVSNAHAA